MSILLLPIGSDGQSFDDVNGAPRSGAKLFVFLANTSTHATLFQNAAGSVSHTNPIILNSSGQVANGSGAVKPIFLASGQTYDVILAPSNDTDPPASAYWTLEDISAVNDISLSSTPEWISGTAPTYVSATSFTVTGNQTAIYHPGRRLKTTNTSGTIYSTISSSAYTTLTAIAVINDTGTLDSGLSVVSYGLISSVNSSGIGSATANIFFATQTIQSTDASATAGPDLILDRSSASPLASDNLGTIRFRGKNSSAATVEYASIVTSIVDTTAGSEDGGMNFTSIVAGAIGVRGYYSSGFVWGNPSGGSLGAGTINAASGFYENGAKLGLGANQVWNNVTGSRSVTTAYIAGTTQSTGGKPIQVCVSVATNTVPNVTKLEVNTGAGYVTVGQSEDNGGGGSVNCYQLSANVPHGASYRITQTAGTVSIRSWAELY